MPRLIAQAAFSYAGRALKSGDEFEAIEKDAELLKLTKRASDAKADDVTGSQLDLAVEKASDQTEAQSSRRGRYSRRDMRSEG